MFKPLQPRSLELAYYGDVKKTVDAWDEAVIMYSSLLPSGDERLDSKFEDMIDRFMAAVTGEWDKAFAEINFAYRFGQVALFQWQNWRREVKAGTKFELPATQPYNEPGMRSLLDRWVNKNTDLIKGFKEQRDQQLIDKVHTAVMQGKSRKQLIAEILPNVRTLNETIAGATKLSADQRADLIATDQILTANAQLNQTRMDNADVEYYIWRGMEDSRERPMHVRLNNLVFRRDGQPMTDEDLRRVGKTGQRYRHPSEADPSASAPGIPVRCRCYGEAVFDEAHPYRQYAKGNWMGNV